MSHRPCRKRLIAALCVAAICVSGFSSAGNVPDIKLTAHRGASANCPENTMASFQAAAALGVDCIELDLRLTSDGVFVVSHDENLSRTTGVDRDVDQMSCEELRKLNAGSGYSPEYDGERIPTFEEVLQMAKKLGLRLDAEIKPDTFRPERDVKRLIALIERYQMQDLCTLSSDDYEVLRRVKEYSPGVTTDFVVGKAPARIDTLEYANEISMNLAAVTSETVEEAHNAGKRLLAWTVDTPAEVRAMTDLRVDGIITDNPVMVKLVWMFGR